jgi:L-lysine 6-transaminase
MSIKIAKTSFWNIKADLSKSHNSYLFDINTGREYLDFFSMYSSMPLGYNHEIFEDGFYDELKKVAHVKIANCEFDSAEKDEFIDAFYNFAGCNYYSNFHFTCTGALAVECACKLAIEYTGKKRIVSISNSFHGVQSYGNFTTDRFYPVSERLDGFPDFNWPKVKDISDFIKEVSSGDVAALLIEPIQSTFGDNYLNKSFIKELCQEAKSRSVPVIFDEIQTGFGVTGDVWYFNKLNILPDIVVFGKKSQVSGIMSRPDLFYKKNGRVCVTFDGDLVDMLRCKYIIKAYDKFKLLDNASLSGEKISNMLKSINGLCNVRNCGLLLAVDFDSKNHRDYFTNTLKELGMICNPTKEKTVRFRPNMAISENEIYNAINLISQSCKSMLVRDNQTPSIPY